VCCGARADGFLSCGPPSRCPSFNYTTYNLRNQRLLTNTTGHRVTRSSILASTVLLSSWKSLTGTKMGNGVEYAGASSVVMLPPSLVLPPLIFACMSSAVGFMHDVRCVVCVCV
jgi:hypothetical protein